MIKVWYQIVIINLQIKFNQSKRGSKQIKPDHRIIFVVDLLLVDTEIYNHFVWYNNLVHDKKESIFDNKLNGKTKMKYDFTHYLIRKNTNNRLKPEKYNINWVLRNKYILIHSLINTWNNLLTNY